MKHIIKWMPRPALALMATAFLLGTTDYALAASNLGEVICNAFNSSKPFIKVFFYAAYTIGVFMVLMGINGFRQHSESPQNHPLHRPLFLWLGAMCLLVFPKAAGTVIMSVYGTSGGNGTLACSAGATGGGGVGLDGMMSGLVSNIAGPIIALCSIIAIVAGVFMMLNGFVKAGRHGHDPKSHSVQHIMANLVFGALLMTIGTNLKMMMGSVFGTSAIPTVNVQSAASSVIGWGFVSSLGGGSQQFATAVGAALTFIQVIGVIAFVRGWLLLKKVVEGGSQATMAQAITHIVGGVLAINIPEFLHIMDRTFGTNLL